MYMLTFYYSQANPSCSSKPMLTDAGTSSGVWRRDTADAG